MTGFSARSDKLIDIRQLGYGNKHGQVCRSHRTTGRSWRAVIGYRMAASRRRQVHRRHGQAGRNVPERGSHRTNAQAVKQTMAIPSRLDEDMITIFRDWAVGADRLQWILYRRRSKAKGGWAPMSFVRSTRNVLERCMREKGCPDGDRARLLAGLPPTFDAWLESSKSRSQPPPDGPRELSMDLPAPANHMAGVTGPAPA